MNIQESVTTALEVLESASSKAEHPPATVICPPNSGDFIIGNESGLVQMAIATLKVAKGIPESFEKEPWWVVLDLDWTIGGIKLDPSAHIYLPPTQTGFQRLRQKALGFCILLFLAASMFVGFITIVRWAIHLSLARLEYAP